MKHVIAQYRQVFIASFLLLFVELTLIRWIPGQVTMVSYFSNLILLGSFLGMGLGLLLAKKQTRLLPYFSPLLLITVILSVFYRISFTTHTPGIIYFGSEDVRAQSPELILILIFCLVTVIMIPVAQEIGRHLKQLPPLQGYSANILGSLAGIALFSFFSIMISPPYLWFTVIAIIYLILLGKSLLKPAAIAMILIPLVIVGFRTPSIWSAYHKLTIEKDANAYMIYANNIAHQVMISSYAQPSFYFEPYSALSHPIYKRVLVIGAGTGGDIAITLLKNPSVEHIDALEIDPVVISIGKQLHPEHPYDDPRVNVIVGDARTYLQTSHETYDLILYALPDSLTITNFSSNIRLESFLFTTQSFAWVKKHLAPDGLFAIYNYYREPWLIDKIGQMLIASFGYPPFYRTYVRDNNAATFLIGPKTKDIHTKSHFKVFKPTQPLPLASDDWPFPYLQNRNIPSLYITLIVTIIILSTAATMLVAGREGITHFDVVFFLFGAAFLLLETRSIATFQLMFGSTWWVNSLVFAGILTAVLLANAVSAHMQKDHTKIISAVLFISLLAAFFIPPDWFLSLPSTARFIGACCLYFCPILAADILFGNRFKKTAHPDSALGANVLGSVVGGTLEYTALILGYRMLLPLAAVLYALALVKKPKSI